MAEPGIFLRLGEAHKGWVLLELGLGLYRLRSDPSRLLNDPVEELLDVAFHSLTPPRLDRRVLLWEEPCGYAIECEPSVGGVRITVRGAKSFFPPRFPDDAPVEHVCVLKTCDRARAIVDGIRGWDAGPWANAELYGRRVAEIDALLA